MSGNLHGVILSHNSPAAEHCSKESKIRNNTKLIKDNIVEEVKKMKREPGTGMVIMGSGTIVSQL